MADVPPLHEEDDDDHRHDVVPYISPQNNHLPPHLDEFDVRPPDLDFFHRLTRRVDRIVPPVSASDRENQVNFVIDMIHQRVEQSRSRPEQLPQSHSVVRSVEDDRLFLSDRGFRVVEENDDIISNEFEMDFGAASGFLFENYDNPNCDDDDNSGFMVADSGDDFFPPSRAWDRHGTRSESGDSSQVPGTPEIYSRLGVADVGSDSDEAGENDIIEVVDGGCDEEAGLQFCWDAFQLEDDTTTANPNANEDFEWEEVNDRIDERELFDGAEPDDDGSVLPVLLSAFEEPREEHDALEWQVLSNVHSFEPYPDIEDQYEEDNYAEYEMFFGQFADSDAPSSGRPPASKTVVVNLSTLLMTEEDAVKNNILCAVCKDELVVGEKATQLPCSHRFHGDCILPWLAIRNTCPVCRHELPTDDLDYEHRKAERVGHT